MIDNIKGLVRPYISVALVSVTAYLAITGKIDPKDMLSLTGVIIAFHFGERSGSKQENIGPLIKK